MPRDRAKRTIARSSWMLCTVANRSAGPPTRIVVNRASGSSRVIAVAEFYQLPDELEAEVNRDRLIAWGLVAAVDKYIVESQPWALGEKQDDESRSRLATTLYTSAEALRIVTALAHPVPQCAHPGEQSAAGEDPGAGRGQLGVHRAQVIAQRVTVELGPQHVVDAGHHHREVRRQGQRRRANPHRGLQLLEGDQRGQLRGAEVLAGRAGWIASKWPANRSAQPIWAPSGPGSSTPSTVLSPIATRRTGIHTPHHRYRGTVNAPHRRPHPRPSRRNRQELGQDGGRSHAAHAGLPRAT